MADRVYLSTITAAWTLPRQRELLADVIQKAGSAVYEDVVSERARKAHRGDDLTERADLLKPTARRAEETIHVASLSVLAWDAADLLTVFAAAYGRNAYIVAHDTGLIIPPKDGVQKVNEAVQSFLTTRRDAQTGIGRAAGARVAADNRKARTVAKIALIRDRWHLREPSTKALLTEAGLTYPTAVEHLGSRPVAQTAWERKEARRIAKEKRTND